MTTGEALNHYKEISERVFSDDNRRRFWINPLDSEQRRLFSANIFGAKWDKRGLESAINKIVLGKYPPASEDPFIFAQLPSPQDLCKVGVLSYKRRAVVKRLLLKRTLRPDDDDLSAGPRIFRTFHAHLDESMPGDSYLPMNDAVECGQASILEASRATTAAPFKFDPQAINGATFIDGGAGTNNPSYRAWREVMSQIMSNRRDDTPSILIVSIGTGFDDQERPRSPWSLVKKWSSVMKEVTETEKTHEFMCKNMDPNNYFRLNFKGELGAIKLDAIETNGQKTTDFIDNLISWERTADANTDNDIDRPVGRDQMDGLLEKMDRLAEKLVNNRRQRATASSHSKRFENCNVYVCREIDGNCRQFPFDVSKYEHYSSVFLTSDEMREHLRTEHDIVAADDQTIESCVRIPRNGSGPWI
ncbi:hypothetical protein H2204_006955 [Knufia peltigerae]|uniref:FabD/lysophospholipase-like protein n=1 Tax=Knufia peltigerae TaxID=1002370 RepID=A0AA38Y2I7_9EURO|nr:hypothetical protein H2204_006955 [Knufia peltigerae]